MKPLAHLADWPNWYFNHGLLWKAVLSHPDDVGHGHVWIYNPNVGGCGLLGPRGFGVDQDVVLNVSCPRNSAYQRWEKDKNGWIPGKNPWPKRKLQPFWQLEFMSSGINVRRVVLGITWWMSPLVFFQIPVSYPKISIGCSDLEKKGWVQLQHSQFVVWCSF